jgi:hypothetical protein
MPAPLNPIASRNLPSFITGPGETNVLMVVTAVILTISVLMFGITAAGDQSSPRQAKGADACLS